MPQVCSVCVHPQRDEIEKAILAGQSFRNVAKQFSLSGTAVFRHKSHLPSVLIKAKQVAEENHAENLVEQIRFLHEKALNILEKAERAGDLRTALLAVREARGNLDLSIKVTALLFEKQQQIREFEPPIADLREAREVLLARICRYAEQVEDEDERPD